MTKHKEYLYPDPIPGFDVLKWKQENQARIRRETEGMTDTEVREYFRKGSEEFRAEQRLRRAAENQTQRASRSSTDINPKRLQA